MDSSPDITDDESYEDNSSTNEIIDSSCPSSVEQSFSSNGDSGLLNASTMPIGEKETNTSKGSAEIDGFSPKPSTSDNADQIETTIKIASRSSNNLRISDIHNFGEKGNILNSTMLKEKLYESNNTTPVKGEAIDFTKESMRTPRNVRQVISSRSPSPEIVISDTDDDDDEEQGDIIDISDEKSSPKVGLNKNKQLTLIDMFAAVKEEKKTATPPIKNKDIEIKVSAEGYNVQRDKIRQMEADVGKAKNMLRTINLNNLPDKGKLLIERHHNLENTLQKEIEKLEQMVIDTSEPTRNNKKQSLINWGEIEQGANAVQPKTFGKTAMATYNAEKALTMEKLEVLHGSLKTCPSESTMAEDPKGLKVDLMPHQKHALAWLLWRENQKPSGGILADDMGLGKTLSMLSLMLKSLEIERSKNDDDDDDDDDENEENEERRKKLKYRGGTLIVCPASLLGQWTGELERRTRRGLASCELYHGAKRETKAKRLAKYDMVVTTYTIVQNEVEQNGAIFRIKWRRIVLDEAHQIRNHKSKTSEAVCKLSAKSRWSLTGTPIHNKELDIYAQLKFLRCTPFDELPTFKRWIGEKSTGGQERLHTVISSLILRRTKAELMENGSLQSLPKRNWELFEIKLNEDEMNVYTKILIFSRTLFAQYLHQHAEKNQDRRVELASNGIAMDPNQEYFKMRNKLLKFNNCKDVKSHEILVLLLRLRQICCHPSLITGMLNDDEDLGGVENPEEAQEMNLLDQLNKLNLEDENQDPHSNSFSEGVGLTQACKNILNLSNPIFSEDTQSTKVKIVLETLKSKVLPNGDKAIVVSQWTSLLNIVAKHLKSEKIRFDRLDGSIPIPKRGEIVDRFNDPHDKNQILLLSLTAGGVGLNLVGANHLLLMDLHWNPQLESQAQDRIYRFGQKKEVNIYKFMTSQTIEERIKQLQDKKKEIAESLLTGTKQSISSKLTLQDLKMLFDM